MADGIADSGWAIVLADDQSYWRPGWKADPVDSAFRIHEGSVLEGTRAWGVLAGSGTTRKRDTPLMLGGRHECRWHDYSIVPAVNGKPTTFRYLALEVFSA